MVLNLTLLLISSGNLAFALLILMVQGTAVVLLFNVAYMMNKSGSGVLPLSLTHKIAFAKLGLGVVMVCFGIYLIVVSMGGVAAVLAPAGYISVGINASHFLPLTNSP